jgi:hypothetical protein
MNEKDIKRIKEINERWAKRGPEWYEKRRKTNRRIGDMLKANYTYQPEWTGKQYKAVRG